MTLVNTDTNLRNLLMFGIEGKHYEKINDKQIKKFDGKKYDVVSWAYGNLLGTYVSENDPVDKWDAFEEFNNSLRFHQS